MKTRNEIVDPNHIFDSSVFMQVHVGSRTYIEPTEIIMISADINYSYIYLSNGKKIFVSTNIQKLQERLLGIQELVRVHRSHIININYLQSHTEKQAALKNNLNCPISRRKLDNLLTSLNH